MVSLGIDVDPSLLEQALTHRSFAYENGGIPHNERLEFLGDSILGQAITVMLYREYPDLPEGVLAKRRASLVSSVALAQVARRIRLGDYLLLGRGEDQSGGRDKTSILSDTIEAVIGAVFLDAGHEAATDLVLRLLSPLFTNPEHFEVAMDPKTSLQERAARDGLVPVYEVTSSGPDHARVFHAVVTVGSAVSATGDGSSKRHAEMAAAFEAWRRLTEKIAAD